MSYLETGFGTYGTQDFARFAVLHTDRGEYPDWSSRLLSVTDQIVGSSNFETQLLGFGPATILLTIDFENLSDFRAFQSHWGKKQTLVLLAQFTRHEGELRHILDRDYEFYDNTLLIDVSNPVIKVGNDISCVATFQRSTSGMGVSL